MFVICPEGAIIFRQSRHCASMRRSDVFQNEAKSQRVHAPKPIKCLGGSQLHQKGKDGQCTFPLASERNLFPVLSDVSKGTPESPPQCPPLNMAKRRLRQLCQKIFFGRKLPHRTLCSCNLSIGPGHRAPTPRTAWVCAPHKDEPAALAVIRVLQSATLPPADPAASDGRAATSRTQGRMGILRTLSVSRSESRRLDGVSNRAA